MAETREDRLEKLRASYNRWKNTSAGSYNYADYDKEAAARIEALRAVYNQQFLPQQANKWARDASDFAKKISADAQARSKGYQSPDSLKAYQDSISPQLSDLIGRAKYAQQYAGLNNDAEYGKSVNDTLSYLNSIGKSLQNEQAYWAQWANEDAYKKSGNYYNDTYGEESKGYKAVTGRTMASMGDAIMPGSTIIPADTEYTQAKEIYKLYSGRDYDSDMLVAFKGAVAPPQTTESYAMELDQNERSLYLWLYDKEGKEKANEYLRSLQDTLAYRRGEAISKNIDNMSGGNQTARDALNTLYALPAGVNAWAEGMMQAVTMPTGQVRAQSPWAVAHSLNREKGSDVGNVFSDLSYTFGNMAPSMAIGAAINAATGGVGGAIAGDIALGLSSAGNSYGDARREGYDHGRAMIYGLVNGTLEAGMQHLLGGIKDLGGVAASKISKHATSYLNKLSNAGVRAVLQTGSKFLTTVGSEATEEYLQSVLDPLVRNIILGEDNDFWAGFTSEDALYSALLGALSAGLLEGPGIITSAAEANKIGKRAFENGSWKGALDYAMQLDPESEPYKLAKALRDGTIKADGNNVGNLYTSLSEYMAESKKLVRKGKMTTDQYTSTAAAINTIYQARLAAQQQSTPAATETAIGTDIPSVLNNDIYQEVKAVETDEKAAVREANIIARIADGDKSVTGSQIDSVVNTNAKTREIVSSRLDVDLGNTNAEARRAVKQYMNTVSATKTETAANTNTQTAQTETANTAPKTEEETRAQAIRQEADAITKTMGTEGQAVYKQFTENMNLGDSLVYATEAMFRFYNQGVNAENSKHPSKKFRDIPGYEGISAEMKQAAYNAGRVDVQAKSGSIAEIVTKTKETAEKAAQQQAEIKKNAKASKVNIKELAPSAGKWSVDPKIDMDTLTTKQTAAVSYLKAVSEVSGMNITLMSGVDVTGEFSVENGHYDGVTNTLYVSVNAGMQSITDITGSAILKTASHEITHYIAASGTQTYSLLEDYVLSRFTEQYGEKSVDNRIEDIQEQYKDQVGKELTREQAKEEMVAAACEMMLKNSEVFEKLARQNLSLAQRIKAGLDGFIKKLSTNRKAAFENLDATSPEARAIAASEASLKETQKLWDNALKGAIKENEGGKSASTGSMSEIRSYDYSKTFAQQIDDYKAGKFPRNDTLVVCGTPEVFQKIGLNALPMTYTQGHLRDALANADGDHLGEALLKKLPAAMQDPLAIINSATRPGRLVAIVEIQGQTRNTIAAVEIDGTGLSNGYTIDANAITSAHSRDNALSNLLRNAVTSELAGKNSIYYWQKNKAIQRLNGIGVQFPGSSSIADGYIHSIRDAGSFVNTKFENVTQTQQFKRWFGDWQKNPKRASKVVNADGTPKIVYHQTENTFTVFDTRHSGAGTHDSGTPFGVFLKGSDRDIGLKGKKQMALYARITNPLQVENRTELTKLIRGMSPEYDSLIKQYDALNSEYKAKTDEAITAFKQYLIDWRRSNPNADSRALYEVQEFNALYEAEDKLVDEWTKKADSLSVKAKEAMTKALRDNGYDGVFLKNDEGSFGRKTEAYIALDPTQVKSATDNIGTFDRNNPDIRYQLREVTPVEPSSEKWARSLTTAEAKQRFPDLWDVSAEESDTRNPTQVKITESSYRKIYDILKQEGFDGTILDASSGLGHGTRVGIEDYGFKVDDIEPYPSKDYSPKYTDYSKLDKTYDAIISNAVLNVLPQDQRDALVVKMGQMLNPGGQMFINVRGDDVLNASSKEIINRDNLEVYITKSGSYQKGFTRNELVAYLQDALGDGYTVRADNRFGKVSAVVTKATNTDVRFELRDNQGRELTQAQAEKFKDSQVRDKDGRLKTVYHGSSAVFNVFSADFMSQHGSSEGQGFYFTDYKDMAEGYQKKGGQLLEGYLNITNPLSDSEVTLSAPEVKRLLKALDPTGDDVILNYDSQGGMGYPSKAWYNRALADTVNMIMSTSESDSEILAEIANAGAGSGNVMDTVRKVLGYDGYIVEGKYGNANVYVAFGSDQFKSFDNKTPTSSPDIHLELRSDENQFNPRKELSNLFMEIAQNEQEKKSLRSYQAAIHELNNTEIEISKLQQEMQGTDKLKSPQKYYELQNKLRQAEAKLNRYDGRLVQLEATKPMKDLIARREQRLKEQFARSSTTRAKYRNNIKKNIRSLDKKLRTNSGQKHVLLELQPVVAQLLNVFTENTSVFKKEQLARLREIYAKFNPEADSKISSTEKEVTRWKSTAEYSSAYSEMIYDLIEEVRPLVQGKRLIDLDTDLLAAVNDIVSNINKMVNQADEMFIAGRAESLREISENTMRDMENSGYGQKRNPRAETNKTAQNAKSFFSYKNAMPVYVFERLGDTAVEKLWDPLQAAAGKKAREEVADREYWQGLRSKYNHKSWDNNGRLVQLESGRKIYLTPQEAMSIYALDKREATHRTVGGKNIKHLQGGGISFPGAAKITVKDANGKTRTEYRLATRGGMRLTEGDIKTIVGLLTQEQRAYADDVVKYLSTTIADRGNAVSRELYGINIFNEIYYFPITVNDTFLKKNITGQIQKLIRNAGMTNALTQDASKPVDVMDFDSIVAQHLLQMEAYDTLAIPLDNFQRWLNYESYGFDAKGKRTYNDKTVSQTLTDVYGKEMQEYISNFLTDVNAASSRATNDGLLDKAIGVFKKNAVLASLSVAIQQPSAIGRALLYIDPKYFVGEGALKSWSKANLEEMIKYSDTAFIKENGAFDPAVSRGALEKMLYEEPETVKEKIKEFFNRKDSTYRDNIAGWLPGVMDSITWRTLWMAIKNETADAHPELSRTSEEFLQIAGKRMDYVVNRTQVYDSMLSKSELMRSKSALMKMTTAFMNEPTTAYNMLYHAAEKLAVAKGTAKKAAAKHLARAVASFVTATALNALLKSLVTAARKDNPDDEDGKTYIEWYAGEVVGNFFDDLNPIKLLPVLRDVFSLIEGYDVERSDMESISKLIDAGKAIVDGNASLDKKLEKLLIAVGVATGIPLENLIRDTKGLRNIIMDIADGWQTTAEGVGNAAKSGLPFAQEDEGSINDKLFRAYMNQDEAAIKRYEQTVTERFNKKKSAGGYTGYDSAEYYIRKEMRSRLAHTDEIKAVYDAAAAGDLQAYKAAVKALTDKGFKEIDVLDAKRSYANNLKKAAETPVQDTTATEPPEEETVIFDSSMFTAALENNDGTDRQIIEQQLEGLTPRSEEYKDKAAKLKSRITAYLKPKYQDAFLANDTATMLRISRQLQTYRQYGIVYNAEILTQWRKAARTDRK